METKQTRTRKQGNSRVAVRPEHRLKICLRLPCVLQTTIGVDIGVPKAATATMKVALPPDQLLLSQQKATAMLRNGLRLAEMHASRHTAHRVANARFGLAKIALPKTTTRYHYPWTRQSGPCRRPTCERDAAQVAEECWQAVVVLLLQYWRARRQLRQLLELLQRVSDARLLHCETRSCAAAINWEGASLNRPQKHRHCAAETPTLHCRDKLCCPLRYCLCLILSRARSAIIHST